MSLGKLARDGKKKEEKEDQIINSYHELLDIHRVSFRRRIPDLIMNLTW